MRTQEPDEGGERMHGPKLAAPRPGGPRGAGFLACALVAALACQRPPESEPPILIEPGREVAIEQPESRRTAAPPVEEVVIIERQAAVGEVSGSPEADPPAASPKTAAPESLPGEAPGPSADDRLRATVLPAGTLLQVELRTPLHTATSRRGDRVAARLVRSVELGGRVVLPAGTLVEGTVVEVFSTEEADEVAEEPDSLARIELAFRSISLPSGERRTLEASVAAPSGNSIEQPRISPTVGTVGGAAAGAVLGGVLGGRRSAGVGAVLGSLAGMAIVGATKDREVIVPSGTPLDLVLVAPLELAVETDRS